MVKYVFKNIAIVPKANEFIDVILSKTQRKTPTIIHPGYEISRIRSFYKRKIKFTQQNCQEKMQEILSSFPRLDDIHPFYSDLINILYDKDHYKLALGQLNKSKTLISQISDVFRKITSRTTCKQLKRAALGRMCTLIKKQASSLAYLEEVRKHLARLPSIDPTTRTLLICGYPNVGKSSFMNKVTRANVDVQPYAFTTKSLFVGHMDYEYLRWQVIDTPGILDHALEERNTIEMQSITALAHLQCCVLYFIDISCECGYTIEQQLSLFQNIQPLFVNKPVFLICNKIDVTPFENLPIEYQQNISESAKRAGAQLMFMSGLAEIGIFDVRNLACKSLLEQRIELKTQSKRNEEMKTRLKIIRPKPRDNNVRSVCIPQSVIDYASKGVVPKTVIYTGRTGRDEAEEYHQKRMESEIPIRKTQKEIQWERGGPGVYAQELYEHYKGMLKSDEWISDNQPHIMDGMNVIDFYDADIEEKLKKLEEEEEILLGEFEQIPEESDLDSELEGIHDEIVSKKKILKERKVLKTTINHPIVGRGKRDSIKPKQIVEELEPLQMETEGILKRGKKRVRPIASDRDSEEIESKLTHKRRAADGEQAFSTDLQRKKAKELEIKGQKASSKGGKSGESDRMYQDKMPKFLFSGKRSNGTTDWR